MESWHRPAGHRIRGRAGRPRAGGRRRVAGAPRHGVPVEPLETFGRDSTAEGRRELRALRREPMVDFRAPGTRMRSTTVAPAGKDWWNADRPTEIRQLFAVDGEPGDAVDTYRRRAEAAGWQPVETMCSFEFQSTSVVLTRAVADRPATLKAYGFLERPRRDRGLVVTLTVEPPDGPPQGPRGRLAAPAGRPLPSGLVPADKPLAHYEDRRSAQDQGDERYLLVDGGTSPGPRAAWVDTRLGPVEIYGGRILDARQLAALSVLLARR